MAEKAIKTRVAIDGEADFKRSLQQINSNLTVMQSNLRSLSSEYTTNRGHAKNLKQQNELLSDEMSQQKEKIKVLSSAVSESGQKYDEAKKKLGEMILQHGAESDEAKRAAQSVQSAQRTYDSYRTQLHNAETALNSMNGQVRENTDELKEMNKQKLDKVINAVKELGNACAHAASVGVSGIKAGIEATSKEFEIAAKGVKIYGEALVATTTAVAGFAVKSGQDYEASMSNVKALSGATGDDLKALGDKAKEMGANTSKSAAESADALGYMALAGWKTDQMLTGLEPILRASEAGSMDLATCSDLVTDSMSSLGIRVDGLNHYLDVCTKTQSSANTSMQGLLEAYVACGGTMKNMGVPLETSATMLGALANRGIKGAEAGTALNSIMVNLMGNTKRTSEAMGALGVSMYENGQRREINDVLMDLNGALANCDEQSRDTFTAFLGGKTQMDTLQAMLAGMGEEYGDLNAKIKDCDGCLIDTAKTMQDNFKGAVTAMKSALEGLGISIYETFSVKLQDSVKLVTGWISQLSTAVQNGNVLGTIIILAADIRKEILRNIVQLASKMSENIDIFNQVILEIVRTIIDMLPAVTATILPKLIQGFTSLVTKLVAQMPTAAKNIASGARTLFSGLLTSMQEISQAIIAVLPETISNISSQLSADGVIKIGLAGFDILMSLVNAVLNNLPAILQAGVEMLTTLLNGIMERLPDLITMAMTLIMSLVEAIVENLPFILDCGVKILLEVINGIVEKLPDLISAAVDIVLMIVDTILNNLGMIIEVALEIIIALVNGIIENLDKIFDEIPKVVEAVVKAIIDNLDLLIEAAIQILIAIGAALIDCVAELTDFIPQVIDAIGEAFVNTDWGQIGRDIMNGIMDGIMEIGENAEELLSNACSKIKNAFTDFFDIHSPSRLMKKDVGTNLALGITEGFAETMNDETSAMLSAMPDFKATVNAESAYNINTSSAERRGETVVYITFGDVILQNVDTDIDNIAIQIEERTRAVMAGKGA